MEAKASNIFKLLKNCDTVFNIPVFQRNYDWEVTECEQLFYDVERVAEDSSRTHFIGSIVTNSIGTASDPYYNIVDGQQRITSVMLLLRALYDNSSNERFRRRIRNGFLMSNDSETGKPRIKLKQVESDRVIYDRLMGCVEFDEGLFTAEEQQSNVYRNYVCFSELVDESYISCEKLFDGLERLTIIDVGLTGEDPQEIFESMNSTGRPLTNTDLLRNYLFMGLDRDMQMRLYTKYWLGIEQDVGKKRMDQFMCTYLIYKRKSNNIFVRHKSTKVSPKTLYYAFKHYYAENMVDSVTLKPEEILMDIYKYSVLFSKICNLNPAKDRVSQSIYELIYDLNADATIVLIMYFMEMHNDNLITSDDLFNALQAIISYVFRSKVLGNSVGVQFFSLAIQAFDRCEKGMPFMEKVWQALTSGKGRFRFPHDAEFENAIRNKDFYIEFNPQFIRYALYKFEGVRTHELVDREDVTIEHILPRDASKWKDYLDSIGDTEYERYVHRLGNLTLTKYNSELSNDTFDRKRELYLQSNYMLTRDVAIRKEWNSREISNRCFRMASRAIRIWSLPPEYNNGSDGSVYQFDNMDAGTQELFDMLVDLVREQYPMLRERATKYLLTYYSNRGLFSIIPLQRSIRLTLYMPDSFDDSTGFVALRNDNDHRGVGNYVLSINTEDDLWKALDYIEYVCNYRC